jgi:phosphatidylserine/phosphatidylglycerophosphate/cardiolipin synthase-like enzyme
MAAGDQFFLASADVTDPLTFRMPKRPGSTIRPLIDGIETFKAIEHAVGMAQTSVHFAAWFCDADLPLQSKDDVNEMLEARGAKNPGAAMWKDLFGAIAAFGVEVRIILTDFDPLFQPTFHAACWTAYRRFRAAAKAIKSGTAPNLQLMCSLHDAQMTPGSMPIVGAAIEATTLTPRLTATLATLNQDAAAGKNLFKAMPRLWPYVEFAQGAFKKKGNAPPLTAYPVSHHQKICIVDGEIGFCGGLDPVKGRLDTPAHAAGWHDLHVQVDKGLAADLDRNFIGRWNTERSVFNTFVTGASSPGRSLGAETVGTIAAPPSPPPGPAPTAGATGQLLRTLAAATSLSVGQLVPPSLREDIREAFQNAIAQAQSFIYIENQYVRDPRLVTWLSAAAARNVNVILVLPVAPEEVSEKNGADDVTKKGLFLQNTIITSLKTLGAKFGVYSMVMPSAAATAHATNFAGSFQIYVHSKTLIVDDAFAMVGSANTNPRSFAVDTEANIAWYDPAGVKNLRLTLWREMLGHPSDLDSWAPADFVTKWNGIAGPNFTAKPALRKGFVVPHNPANIPGADRADIPAEYTELMNYDSTGTLLT